MKCDLIVAGVGGQGVLSLGSLMAWSALREGLRAKQSEVHGMSQRGGAVVAHLRLADRPIMSDLIPSGGADLIVSMEPLEPLRYLGYLSPDGALVTSTDPVRNTPTYPDTEELLATLSRLPNARLVEAGRLAREAGSLLATNTVMIGAAADLLPLKGDIIEACIRDAFERKGAEVVETNLRAFRAGREWARCVSA